MCMKIDALIPIKLIFAEDFDTPVPDLYYSDTKLLEAIEIQRLNDFCENDAEYYDKFSYSKDNDEFTYTIETGTKHMTFRNGKLYLCFTLFIKTPTWKEMLTVGEGQTMAIHHPCYPFFKEFMMDLADHIEGDMGDGWGEGFEQHAVRYANNSFYVKPYGVEYFVWNGEALDDDGVMRGYVKFDPSKPDSNLFKHGFVNGDDCMALNTFCNNLGMVRISRNILRMPNSDGPAFDYERKSYAKFFKKYGITEYFVRKYIDYYLDMCDSCSYWHLDADERKAWIDFRDSLPDDPSLTLNS